MNRLIPLIAALGIFLAGCGASTQAAKHAAQPVTVTVAMGYIPDVQFAPYYVALARGYYRQAGLKVRLKYGIEPDLLTLAQEGKVDLVVSGGDEVLAAGAHGVKVRYVMTQYSRFPSALFALRSSGIHHIAQLRGKTIGIPGAYGASYAGLLALLHAAHLSTSQVTIHTIGYTQVAAVATHKVDAAVGYATNEPIELRHEGYQVTEFDIARWANIAGAGLAAGDGVLAHHPAMVRAFVRATLHGLRDTIAHSHQAYAITARTIKLPPSDAAVQRAVLARSIDFWRAEPGHSLGWVDPAIWRHSVSLLYRFGQLPRRVAPSSFYTNRFITG